MWNDKDRWRLLSKFDLLEWELRIDDNYDVHFYTYSTCFYLLGSKIVLPIVSCYIDRFSESIIVISTVSS
jgi:hypothetical protein